MDSFSPSSSPSCVRHLKGDIVLPPDGGRGWPPLFTDDSSIRTWVHKVACNATIKVRRFLEVKPSHRANWVSHWTCETGLFPTFALRTDVLDCFTWLSSPWVFCSSPPSVQPQESQGFPCTQASWWLSVWLPGSSLTTCASQDVYLAEETQAHTTVRSLWAQVAQETSIAGLHVDNLASPKERISCSCRKINELFTNAPWTPTLYSAFTLVIYFFTRKTLELHSSSMCRDSSMWLIQEYAMKCHKALCGD